jgi:hypothetical protein
MLEFRSTHNGRKVQCRDDEGGERWRIIRRHDLRGLNVGETVDLLEALGSSSDPVRYQGIETTPRDLMDQHFPTGLERDPVYVVYYVGRGCVRAGTLLGMCRDRAGFNQKRKGVKRGRSR